MNLLKAQRRRLYICLLAFFLLAAQLSSQSLPSGLFNQAERIPPKLAISYQVQPKPSLVLSLSIAEGSYLNADPQFLYLEGPIAGGPMQQGAATVLLGPSSYPASKSKGSEFPISYYEGDLHLSYPLYRLAGQGLDVAGPELSFLLHYQACTEEGVCFLPQSIEIKSQLPQNVWLALEPPPTAGTPIGLWLWYSFLAFVGGLILNFMPCIFPIIGIKVQQLSTAPPQDRESGKHSRLASALAYLAGIELSFLGLAALIMLAQQGSIWGFQLQNPSFVLFLALLFLLMAISLWGGFVIRAPKLMQKRSTQQPYLLKQVSHGALLVLLGTPCSAPVLAPVLAWFLLQDKAPMLSVAGFLSMGLGLWLPFALMLLQPKIAGKINRLQNYSKQIALFCGALLLLSSIYLLWVLRSLLSPWWLAASGGLYLVAAISSLLWGRMQLQREGRGRSYLAYGSFALSLLLFAFFSLGAKSTGNEELLEANRPAVIISALTEGEQGEDLFQEQIKGYLQQGHPVFLDFTASWCLSCQLNHTRLLYREDFLEMLRAHNAVYIQADLSRENLFLSNKLRSFGRASLPLYLLFLPGENEPRVLPSFPSFHGIETLLIEG